MDETKIKQLLLQENYVTPEDYRQAEQYAVSRHGSPVDFLLSNGLITEQLLGQAIAESVKMPYADLETYPPDKAAVLKIPEDMARKLRIVVFRDTAKQTTVATDAPSATLLQEVTALFPKKPVKLMYGFSPHLDKAFTQYKKSLGTRFSSIISQQKLAAPELVEEIFKDAITFRASDIHFEPQASDVGIRFRIDGVLQEAARVEKHQYETILNRIKVLARLRIDEHTTAQDGAIRFATNNHAVDLRVSVVPTLEGEKIVIRLLSEYVQNFSLSEIGFSAEDEVVVTRLIHEPFGMILVTGPTGSGKTTTLYSVLQQLNDSKVNITTIEDPVEYRIGGLNQIQVNAQTGLTFAKGLRSIVRQDPNIILVGESRDLETAEISVNAALTGHLLMSTFHANDAVSSIPRLSELGIENNLLASTLKLIVAQRLVRRICSSCRVSETVSAASVKAAHSELAPYISGRNVSLYHGKGCSNCNNTGFKGRMAIFELIEVTPEFAELIISNAPVRALWAQALKQGARPLFADGVNKVLAGITTIEELLRVARPPRI